MTTEQKRRVIEAIDECERVLERARAYMGHNQDKELISKYETHKAKLEEMLA